MNAKEIPQTEIPTETVNEPSVIKEMSKKEPSKTNEQQKRITIRIHNQEKCSKNSFVRIYFGFIYCIIDRSKRYSTSYKLQSVKKESESLKEQIERVKETDISQSKIDTFGRYFLTYYFSQEKK